MDFNNILYTRSYEEIIDKQKHARLRVNVTVTKEENCLIVWRESITWAHRGDDDAETEYSLLKWFNTFDKSTAIEWAVDWIREQELKSKKQSA